MDTDLTAYVHAQFSQHQLNQINHSNLIWCTKSCIVMTFGPLDLCQTKSDIHAHFSICVSIFLFLSLSLYSLSAVSLLSCPVAENSHMAPLKWVYAWEQKPPSNHDSCSYLTSPSWQFGLLAYRRGKITLCTVEPLKMERRFALAVHTIAFHLSLPPPPLMVSC